MAPSTQFSADSGEYCLAIIDILGQQDQLRDWQDHPATEAKHKKFLLAVQSARELIESLRAGFAAIGNSNTPSPAISVLAISNPLVQEYQEWALPDIRVFQFSDTLVAHGKLPCGNENSRILGPVHLLQHLADLFLSTLATGHALRGAVEIGNAIELSDNEIYGPVLADAHKLESRCAQYPRILIGPKLLSHLGSARDNSPSHLASVDAKWASDAIEQLIIQSDDQLPSLHYLHKSGHRAGSNCLDQYYDCANKFVRHEYARFMKSGKLELAARYGRVMSYFDAHSGQWNPT